MQTGDKPKSARKIERPQSARDSSLLPALNERRSSRSATRLRGVLGVPGLRLQLECFVLDVSAGGARVQFDQLPGHLCNAHKLPDAIVLAIPTDRVEVTGTIRWRAGTMFGMRFTSAFAPTQRQFARDQSKQEMMDWVAGSRSKRRRR